MPDESVTVTVLPSSDVGSGKLAAEAVPPAKFMPYTETMDSPAKGSTCPAVARVTVAEVAGILADRKGAVWGKRVNLGGRRILKKKKTHSGVIAVCTAARAASASGAVMRGRRP